MSIFKDDDFDIVLQQFRDDAFFFIGVCDGADVYQ